MLDTTDEETDRQDESRPPLQPADATLRVRYAELQGLLQAVEAERDFYKQQASTMPMEPFAVSGGRLSMSVDAGTRRREQQLQAHCHQLQLQVLIIMKKARKKKRKKKRRKREREREREKRKRK